VLKPTPWIGLLLLPIGLTGVVCAQDAPEVVDGGVLNAASFAKGQAVALGSFVEIFGSGFGKGGVTKTVPWPTSLGNTMVLMNGVPAPLYSVTDGQIAAQVPFEALPTGHLSGSVIIIVQHNGESSAPKNFHVSAFAPGIFSVAGNGLGLAQATNSDGTLAAPTGAVHGRQSHPAAPGATITVLATGLGATNKPIQSGHASNDATRHTTTLPSVLVGGIPAQVAFSGPSPKAPAEDQLNIVLPVGVPAGSAVPIQLSLGGITTSAQLFIAISPSSVTAALTHVATVLTPASQPKSMVTYGNFAYVCGSQYIAVLDITHPASPTLTGTVGSNAFNNVSNLFCYVDSGDLVAFADTGSTLAAGTGPSVTVFSLAHPAKPELIQQTALSKQFVSGVAHHNHTAFVTFNSISFSGSTFLNQGGDLVSVDVSNPSSPKLLNALSGSTSSALGPDCFFDVVAVNDTIAYAASSSSTGSQTATGTGLLLVLDTSNPKSLKVVKKIAVPGTRQVLSVRVQGNLAVTVNDVEGWRNPIDFTQGALVGPTNVTTFDISNPKNPVLLTTEPTNVRPGLSGGGGAPIGTHQFAFAGTRDGDQSGLLIVDARDSKNLKSSTLATTDILHNLIVVAPHYLYTLIDNTGVAVYRIAN
jgi:uncharacterized protein (TIGR03437 family)